MPTPLSPRRLLHRATLLAQDVDVVGIDEAQFLICGLPRVCTQACRHGGRVIVAGLDMDFSW